MKSIPSNDINSKARLPGLNETGKTEQVSAETKTPGISSDGIHNQAANFISRKFELKDYQARAIKSISSGNSLVITAPTGAGKTVIAYAEMMNCLKEGRQFIYTAPLIAINDQKLGEFRDELANQIKTNIDQWKDIVGLNLEASASEIEQQIDDFAKKQVGLKTGDRSVNPDAPFKVMTTEVYNLMTQSSDSSLKKNRSVVFDELHYLGDSARGHVWEESIMFTDPNAKMIGLSATIGNAGELVDWINKAVYSSSAKKMDLIQVPESERPVKLKHYSFNPQTTKNFNLKAVYDEDQDITSSSANLDLKPDEDTKLEFQLANITQTLKENDKLPAIYFIYNKKKCDSTAKYIANTDLNLVSEDEREQIKLEIEEELKAHPSLSLEKESLNLLESGIASHHAEKLPEFKELVSKLFAKGLIKVVTATDTLAAGINMPTRTVVITSLSKVSDDGEAAPLTVATFQQTAGRAGRALLDTEGNVITFTEDNKVSDLRRKYIEASPEPIRSELKPDYHVLLQLINDARDKGSEESLEEILDRYLSKSLFLSQSKETAEALKTEYKKMISFLKELDFIDSDENLTLKGNIALEFKFNNPIFITSFLMALNDQRREAEKGVSQKDLKPLRSIDFVTLVSLLGEDKDTFSQESFDKFMENLVRQTPEIAEDLTCFINSYKEFTEKQTQVGITDQTPSINYSKLYKIKSWHNDGLKKIRAEKKLKGKAKKKAEEEAKKKTQAELQAERIEEFRSILREGDKPGGVLKSLRRTQKLLEYLDKAKRHDKTGHFPKALKFWSDDALGAFRRGILLNDEPKDNNESRNT